MEPLGRLAQFKAIETTTAIPSSAGSLKFLRPVSDSPTTATSVPNTKAISPLGAHQFGLR